MTEENITEVATSERIPLSITPLKLVGIIIGLPLIFLGGIYVSGQYGYLKGMENGEQQVEDFYQGRIPHIFGAGVALGKCDLMKNRMDCFYAWAKDNQDLAALIIKAQK